jgi:hypothetical protein
MKNEFIGLEVGRVQLTVLFCPKCKTYKQTKFDKPLFCKCEKTTRRGIHKKC